MFDAKLFLSLFRQSFFVSVRVTMKSPSREGTVAGPENQSFHYVLFLDRAYCSHIVFSVQEV